MIARAAVLVALVGVASAGAAARAFAGQQPPLLVEVELAGVGATTVEALLTADSTLLLPSVDVAALLGSGRPATTWVTLAGLRAAWPSVTFTWQPRALRVLVEDPGGVLPASRSREAQTLRQARGASFTTAGSGPFFSATADDRQRTLVEGGWSWAGRLAATVRRLSTRGASWSATLAPVPQLFVAYTQGEQLPPTVQGRIAVGPAWLAGTWTRGGARSVDALVQLGPVAFFGSSRNAYAITYRGPISIQVGRIGSTTTGRVSLGPVPPSPFVVPVP